MSLGRARGVLPGVLLLVLLPFSRAAAQTSRMASWTVSLGLDRRGVSDALASPLRQSGSGLFFGGAYGRAGESRRWRFGLSFAAPTIGSSIENARGGFEETHDADLGFSWLHRVHSSATGRLGIFAGGTLDVRVSVRSHHYDAADFGSRTETYGDLFAPAQLAGMWELDLHGGGRLRHTLAVPVLSVAMRSPWTGLKYAPSFSLAGPTKLTGFSSELEWRKGSARGWGIGLFHRATLMRYPDPLPFGSMVQRVGIIVEKRR